MTILLMTWSLFASYLITAFLTQALWGGGFHSWRRWVYARVAGDGPWLVGAALLLMLSRRL